MESESDPRKKRRLVTVYDAVAGRVGYEGFLSGPQASKYRDTASNSATAVPPDEILFRRKNAPMRYEENDIYAADRHLSRDQQRLPESDLLKAVHAYASDFYASATENAGANDWRSMDETSLLAVGILLEEAVREVLGETGYLALLEHLEELKS